MPGRWHNSIESPAGHLQKQYSTPRAWYRRSAQCNPVSSESDYYVDERYITAAAIMELGSDLQPLVDPVNWAVIVFFPGRDYSVVLVSSPEPQIWVEQARFYNARAWYVMESGEVYSHRTVDSIPAGYVPIREGEKRGTKNLDHLEVREDLINGYYNDTELAAKYSVTKQTIANIRKKFGLVNPRARVRVKQTTG